MKKSIRCHYQRIALSILLVSPSAYADTVTLGGEITERSCAYSVSETAVTLPDIDADDVQASADLGLPLTPKAAFKIIADCPNSLKGSSLTVKMYGANAFADSRGDRVLATSASGIGLGLGIQATLGSPTPSVLNAMDSASRMYRMPAGTTELPVYVVPVYSPASGGATATTYTAALNVVLTGA